MRSILHSFRAALRGIVFCINNERNMRIHTVMVVYVLLFLRFFELTRGETALVFAAFGLVIGAEMLNTAMEGLTDKTSPEFSQTARSVKDVAAGAVLVCAVFSVCVAVCLFWQPAAFRRIFDHYREAPLHLAGLAALTVALALYVVAGPPRIVRRLTRKAPQDSAKKEKENK